MTDKNMIFVGLGNPGEKYSKNRHNVGFMAIDYISDKFGVSSYKSKFNGVYANIKINDTKIYLLKPMTMMNNSGQSVKAISDYYKVPPHDIVVFHDELDLAPAKIKLKKGGGAAGHNGLKSIDAHLNSQDYQRVRIGIGHPGDKSRVHGYVLGDFAKSEEALFDDLLYAIAKYAPLLTSDEKEKFSPEVNMFMRQSAQAENPRS